MGMSGGLNEITHEELHLKLYREMNSFSWKQVKMKEIMKNVCYVTKLLKEYMRKDNECNVRYRAYNVMRGNENECK